METEEWMQVQAQIQVLRNDLDVALAALAESRRREEAMTGAMVTLADCLTAEQRCEKTAAETQTRLDKLRAELLKAFGE